MGYPFDKTWNSRVDSTASVTKIIENLPHTKLCDFTIYRKTKLYEGDDTPTPPPGPPSKITWESTIKKFFTERDIKCMKPLGVDLSSHAAVKFRAEDILGMVRSGKMPKPEGSNPERPWSKEKVETFGKWSAAGCP